MPIPMTRLEHPAAFTLSREKPKPMAKVMPTPISASLATPSPLPQLPLSPLLRLPLPLLHLPSLSLLLLSLPMLWLSPLALLSQSVRATRSNDDHNYANENLIWRFVSNQFIAAYCHQSTYCSLLLSINLLQVPVESAHKVARQVTLWLRFICHVSLLLKVLDCSKLETFEVLYSNALKL